MLVDDATEELLSVAGRGKRKLFTVTSTGAPGSAIKVGPSTSSDCAVEAVSASELAEGTSMLVLLGPDVTEAVIALWAPCLDMDEL